nr:immunoglobulin heavy chain junction region [Macaca mulatta]
CARERGYSGSYKSEYLDVW